VHICVIKFAALTASLLTPPFALAHALFAAAAVSDDLPRAVVHLAQEFSRARAVALLLHFIEREVETVLHPDTLFRMDSPATKMMNEVIRSLGLDWMRAAEGPLVEDVISRGVSFECDPAKMPPGADADQARSALQREASVFFTSWVRAASDFPLELRQLCAGMKRSVTGKFGETHALRSVGSFVVLRFLCPVLTTPEAFGFQAPSREARRSLILVAKVLQTLVNLVEFGKKEEFLEPFNAWLMATRPMVVSLLNTLSDETGGKSGGGAIEALSLAERMKCVDVVSVYLTQVKHAENAEINGLLLQGKGVMLPALRAEMDMRPERPEWYTTLLSEGKIL